MSIDERPPKGFNSLTGDINAWETTGDAPSLCRETLSTLCSPSTIKGYPPQVPQRGEPPQRFCETALQEGFPPQRTVEGVSQRVIDEACFARKDASSASESVGGVPPLKGTVEVGSEYSVPTGEWNKPPKRGRFLASKTAVRNASVSPPQLSHRVAVRSQTPRRRKTQGNADLARERAS